MDDKFEYFMERTEKDLEHIRQRVDKLWEFRLLLLGASAAVSTGVAFVFHALQLYFKGG